MAELFTNEVLGPLTDAELRATPVPVSATDLDVRDLTHVSDSVKVGDGTDFLAVNGDGSINVSFSQAAITPTVTSVSVGSGAAVTLLAADSARKRFILFNESGRLFVKFGTSASSTDYSVVLTANTTFIWDTAQTAAITAIKQTGTSNVLVTSFS